MVSHFDGACSVVIRRNQEQLADEFKSSRTTDCSPTPPCHIPAFLLFSLPERGWLDTATTRSTHDPSTDADPLLARLCRINAGRLFEQTNRAYPGDRQSIL